MITFDVARPPQEFFGTNEAIAGPGDTNENIVYTFTRIWRPKTQIRFTWEVSCTNNANAKTMRVRLGGIGGTIFFSRNNASDPGLTVTGTIANRNSLSSQVGSVTAGSSDGGSLIAWGKTTATQNTGVATDLVFTVQKASGGDTVTSERILIEVIDI